MTAILIEIGIILLLIYTPIAAGGVEEISVALVEVVCGALLLLWLASLFTRRERVSQGHRKRHRRPRGKQVKKVRRKLYRVQVVAPLFLGVLCVYCLLIGLQLVPLPGWFVNIISPETSRLYAEGASNTFSTLPHRLPVSVCTQATETEFYKFLAYLALFWVIVNTLRTPQQIKRLVAVILAVGFFEAFTGFRQVSQFRISGTFVNHNHFAGYLELVIPLAFGLFLLYLEQKGPSPFTKFLHLFEDKYLKAFLALFLMLVLIGGLVLSGSRGGIISFSVGMLCFCLLTYTRRLFRKWVKVALIFVLILLGIAVMNSPDIILQRLGALAEPEAEMSFQYRRNVWQNALLIVRDFPVLGSGLGTFSHLFQRYQRFPSDVFFTHTENDYLQLLLETGLVGTALMLSAGGIYAYTTIAAWKRQRSRWLIAIGAGGLSALCSMVVHSGVDFNLHIPSNAILFTVIAAITYTAAHSQKAEDRRQPAAVGSRQSAEGRRQGSTALRGGEQPAAGSGQKQGRSANNHQLNNSLTHQLPNSATQQLSNSITQQLIILGRGLFFLLTGLGGLLILCYLFLVIRAYCAVLYQEQFRETVALVEQGYGSADDIEAITRPLQQATRYDGNNAGYAFALGDYLLNYYAIQKRAESRDKRAAGLVQAEEYVKQAVMRDPADPWYYYELGRINIYQGDCKTSDDQPFDDNAFWSSCSIARYFLAALDNAPNEYFLRRVAGGWFYHYNQELAFWMMRRIIPKATGEPLTADDIDRQIAQFLYDMHLDYESDRWLSRLSAASTEESAPCAGTRILHRSADGTELELGSDDGSAEWKTLLVRDTERVKKIMCLPKNIDASAEIALKVLMNNGGSGNFIAQFFIDDQMIKEYTPANPVPRNATWYEIPFDKALLHGKEKIHVYIRVQGASWHGNCLQIWGDQHISAHHSVLNIDMVEDLASGEKIQTGEYMIRLLVKRTEKVL